MPPPPRLPISTRSARRLIIFGGVASAYLTALVVVVVVTAVASSVPPAHAFSLPSSLPASFEFHARSWHSSATTTTTTTITTENSSKPCWGLHSFRRSLHRTALSMGGNDGGNGDGSGSGGGGGGRGRGRGRGSGGMQRPFLDRLATTLFRLETDRVESSSVLDDKGRKGEPMEWSEQSSFANKLSEIVSYGPGYAFKQFVADIVAGEYDADLVSTKIDNFVQISEKNDDVPVVMFSFSTCPFCRRAKDYLDGRGIRYESMELDELEGNAGNEIRAVLGKKTGRTSVPSIFVRGMFVGGCNDGPGLLPLAERGELDRLLARKG